MYGYVAVNGRPPCLELQMVVNQMWILGLKHEPLEE